MDRQKVIVNFIWRLMERCGAQLVTATVSLVLARLLDPEVYGTVALVSILITVLSVFIDSGLGNALIQKKDADDLDFSSVFYFNMVMCLGLYALVFVFAPLLARFFKAPELTPIIRVLCLTLVVSGVKNIQTAYVSRNMIFKKFFFATLGGTVGAAVVGLWMAFQGYGVWALVAQSLFNNTVDTLILWVLVPWRPKWMFSFQRLRGLFSYGWKLLANSLMSNLYYNLRQLIIGKAYSTTDLAFYNRGQQFPNIFGPNIHTAVNSVLMPAMSAAQDNLTELRGMTRRATRLYAYMFWPMMTGLVVCAEPLVRLVLTEKWLPCVPFLALLCLDYVLWLDLPGLLAIQALGRSDVLLKLELIKKAVALVILIISVPHGVMAIAASVPLTSITTQIINDPSIQCHLGYSLKQRLWDMLPSALLSLFMGICVWSIQLLHLSDIITLLIQAPLGILIYVCGSWLLKLESFCYLKGVLLQYFNKSKETP